MPNPTCRDCGQPRVRGFATCIEHGADPEDVRELDRGDLDEDVDDHFEPPEPLLGDDADFEADRAADRYERWLFRD